MYANCLWTFNIMPTYFGRWISLLKHMLFRYSLYTRNLIRGFSFGVLTDAIQLGLLMEPPTSPLVACTAQRHFWIQTSACSGPVEHVQQYAKVRWVPRVPLNGTSSSALSSHVQHITWQYNTMLFKTQCTEWKQKGKYKAMYHFNATIVNITYKRHLPLI